MRGQLWVMDVASRKSVRIGAENEGSGGAVWSADGKWIAYMGTAEGKHGLAIVRPDGTGATFLAEVMDTNAPLPSTGATVFTWSPDGKQIAFISATPGPETKDAGGDPIVITRYMYKPDAGEGNSHFNDNRRLHIFVVDVATKRVRQLTDGVAYEHSIDWSPNGDEIVYVSGSFAERGSVFQLRYFRDQSERRNRSQTYGDGERGVFAEVVA